MERHVWERLYLCDIYSIVHGIARFVVTDRALLFTPCTDSGPCLNFFHFLFFLFFFIARWVGVQHSPYARQLLATMTSVKKFDLLTRTSIVHLFDVRSPRNIYLYSYKTMLVGCGRIDPKPCTLESWLTWWLLDYPGEPSCGTSRFGRIHGTSRFGVTCGKSCLEGQVSVRGKKVWDMCGCVCDTEWGIVVFVAPLRSWWSVTL